MIKVKLDECIKYNHMDLCHLVVHHLIMHIPPLLQCISQKGTISITIIDFPIIIDRCEEWFQPSVVNYSQILAM